MNRLILWTVGGFALLSAAYLGFVKLAFAPDHHDAPAQAVEAPLAPAPVLAPPPPARPLAAPRSAAPVPRPPAPLADTSAAAPDTAAVRRLTVALAQQTREVAHVGKPVARHVATDALGLDPSGCKVTDGVRLCLVPSAVGGWQVVGASQGYALIARGPARLGEPLAVSVVGASE